MPGNPEFLHGKEFNLTGELAPIGVSTYSRLEHLQRTIAALRGNRLASESELFVFSDAPRPGDEDKVAAVRGFLRSVDGFKSVTIVERSENSRVANNRGGMKMLLDRFGRTIFLEEDVVTAPGFLSFMNQALDKYEKNDKVFSITGYCPPIAIPADYRFDAFFLRRFNGWGLGIWKDRTELIKPVSLDEYRHLIGDREMLRKFNRGAGPDIIHGLRLDVKGQIDALDLKMIYAQFLYDKYTVYPSLSLVDNIGMDGSGSHCAASEKFDARLSEKLDFNFPEHFLVDEAIVEANYRFNRFTGIAGLKRRVKLMLDRLSAPGLSM